MLKRLLLLACLLLAAPALAQQEQVEAALAAAPQGTRFGLLVVDEAGREVVSINPDQRFIPASNTKMFTTAAAYATIGSGPPAAALGGGTALILVPHKKGPPDLMIRGEGGVSLSTEPDCTRHCLAEMVGGLIGKTREIDDVIADDSAFADQRWSPGMSWNNIQTEDGTAVSALIVDDNELPLAVSPGQAGRPAAVSVSPYYTVINETVTAEGGATKLAYERAPNSRELRVYGTIAAGAPPWRKLIGVDDPAHYASWAVRQALRARGVHVTGKLKVVHRPVRFQDPPGGPPQGQRGTTAVIEPAQPLDELVTVINKRSQNLHSEALLRRVGLASLAPNSAQPGSREAGLAAMQAMLETAGLPRAGYDFSDGSGMSSYNRLSPRASVALLRWVATQPWGEQWYASLPVAAQDGTLKRRFAGTPLAGNLAAKTGTLNASNALSGRFRAKSGRMLTFAFFANDVPNGTSALAAMEAALLAVAEGN